MITYLETISKTAESKEQEQKQGEKFEEKTSISRRKELKIERRGRNGNKNFERPTIIEIGDLVFINSSKPLQDTPNEVTINEAHRNGNGPVLSLSLCFFLFCCFFLIFSLTKQLIQMDRKKAREILVKFPRENDPVKIIRFSHFPIDRKLPSLFC